MGCKSSAEAVETPAVEIEPASKKSMLNTAAAASAAAMVMSMAASIATTALSGASSGGHSGLTALSNWASSASSALAGAASSASTAIAGAASSAAAAGRNSLAAGAAALSNLSGGAKPTVIPGIVKPREPCAPVNLYVYDLLRSNSVLSNINPGAGAFHSAVEVYGREYTFGPSSDGGTGVWDLEPGTAPCPSLREKILMGYTTLNNEQVVALIEEMKGQWLGKSYDLLTRNCNCFADALAFRLTGNHAPPYVNFLATLGASTLRSTLGVDANELKKLVPQK
eukprot:gnl/Spiro4/4622_TR2311_c0_g1_i1.p1 gnl/Spiro4/4622_TR2311_c0_g1~~gnl/Spiro4/4622_TR2311_c0_g1_i1.p1  ORF type:complete len:282 (-),score=38.77 gnl/Spiro4/4622_TR2311_c0_g1_i1:134-979(-)